MKLSDRVAGVLTRVAKHGKCTVQVFDEDLTHELLEFGVELDPHSLTYFKTGRQPGPQTFELELVVTQVLTLSVPADTLQGAIAEAESRYVNGKLREPLYFEHQWKEVN